jgi:hypothetical protein
MQHRVLLATIRGLSKCGCMRCTCPKKHFHWLGTAQDQGRRAKERVDSPHRRSMVEKVRDWIFRLGAAVLGSKVDALLKDHSWVPTMVIMLLVVPTNADDHCRAL